MAFAYQKHNPENRIFANNGWYSRSFIWLASSRKCEKIHSRLDVKMKAFIISVTTWCFISGCIAGISMHTLIEMNLRERQTNLLAVHLLTMPIRDLTEYEI